MKELNLPYESDDVIKGIKAGDEVAISGKLYVGRDQAHKRLCETIKAGGKLPFPFYGNAIYYMGPSPKTPSSVIGAAGPTTSVRMDPFSPTLIGMGLKVMVGKGPRTKAVLDAVKEHGGLYLQAFGGCGALYSKTIRSTEMVAYPELGPEALILLEVEGFPTICLASPDGDYLPSALI